MKSMKFAILPWLKTQICVGWVILAAVLPVLFGCATNGTVGPEQVVRSTPANRQPAVEQLADGRKGFVITEVSQLNDAARWDFQRAVTMLRPLTGALDRNRHHRHVGGDGHAGGAPLAGR